MHQRQECKQSGVREVLSRNQDGVEKVIACWEQLLSCVMRQEHVVVVKAMSCFKPYPAVHVFQLRTGYKVGAPFVGPYSVLKYLGPHTYLAKANSQESVQNEDRQNHIILISSLASFVKAPVPMEYKGSPNRIRSHETCCQCDCLYCQCLSLLMVMGLRYCWMRLFGLCQHWRLFPIASPIHWVSGRRWNASVSTMFDTSWCRRVSSANSDMEQLTLMGRSLINRRHGAGTRTDSWVLRDTKCDWQRIQLAFSEDREWPAMEKAVYPL